MRYSIINLPNINLGQLQIILAAAGLLSVLATVSCMLFLSAKCENENLQQLVANSDAGMIFRIPWGHHIQILTKCKGNRWQFFFFGKYSRSH